MKKPGRLFSLVIVVLGLGIVLTLLNIYELHKMRETGNLQQVIQPQVEGRAEKYAVHTPIVWVEGKKVWEKIARIWWSVNLGALILTLSSEKLGKMWHMQNRLLPQIIFRHHTFITTTWSIVFYKHVPAGVLGTVKFFTFYRRQ